jgi:hypothetical protein
MSDHLHSAEDRWTEVQKAALREESVANGIAVVDDYLRAEPPLDLKRQALGFRGSLNEERGDLAAAKADFLAARELAEKADFERYTLEGSAAAVSQRLGQTAEAEHWCLEALKTAAADPTTSGASALLRLLGLRGDRGLREDEEPLVERVIYQASHLLRVEGEPDLEDLEGTAKKLIEAQRGPFSADRPPTPKAYPGPTTDS